MKTGQEPPPLLLHVVIVPTPGMGHLIPLVELAQRLVHRHNFAVTFIIPNDGSSMELQKQLLSDPSLPETISSIFLPPVSFDDLPKDAKIETRIILSLTRSLHLLRDSFKTLTESTRVVGFVVDVFGTDAFDIAVEFGLQPYVFVATNAMLLSLIFELPKLDELFACEYRELPEPIGLPGCVPFRGTDIPDPLQHREDFAYKETLRTCKDFPLACGIIVNSFMELETGSLEALMENRRGLPPVYPVGPLTKPVEKDGSNDCIKWLDKQPVGSVVYVCFGSGGTLSHEQINELAMGLELSGQRFVWVVKNPVDEAANATYFTSGIDNVNGKDPLGFLPDGFLERTKYIGLVVRNWAPQGQVLSHGSIGGFLTHCGWNSVLEAIVNGVPLIAWPLYAEQKMNAAMLRDGLKIAFRVEYNENGLVGREDIARYVKELFEGDEGEVVRTRMRKFRDDAKLTLSHDGSSMESLDKLAQIWKNQKV